MIIRKFSEGFSVSDQIGPDNIKDIVARGFRTIICNRPDGEDESQHSIDTIRSAADTFGVRTLYVPVVHSTISAADVGAFARAWLGSERPVLAYCRSGLRSCTLWSLMQISRGKKIEEIVAMASAAGYDFSDFNIRFSQVIDEITAATHVEQHPSTTNQENDP